MDLLGLTPKVLRLLCPYEQLEAAPMSVIARFYIAEITKSAYGLSEPQRKVVLRAATRGEENKSWAQATPSGTVEMLVNNGEAGKWFEEHLGEDIAISFEIAETAGPTQF